MKKNVLAIACIAAVFGVSFESDAARRGLSRATSQTNVYTPDPSVAAHLEDKFSGSTAGGYNDDSDASYTVEQRKQINNSDMPLEDLNMIIAEKNKQLENKKMYLTAIGKKLGFFKKGKDPEYKSLSQEIKALQTEIKELDGQLKLQNKNIAAADKYTSGAAFSKALLQWQKLNTVLITEVMRYANNKATYSAEDNMSYPKAFSNVLKIYNLYLQEVDRINSQLITIVKAKEKATEAQLYMLKEDIGLLALSYSLLKTALIELQNHVSQTFNNKEAILFTVRTSKDTIDKYQQFPLLLSQLKELHMTVSPNVWEDIRTILPTIYEDSAEILKRIYTGFSVADNGNAYGGLIETINQASQKLSQPSTRNSSLRYGKPERSRPFGATDDQASQKLSQPSTRNSSLRYGEPERSRPIGATDYRSLSRTASRVR